MLEKTEVEIYHNSDLSGSFKISPENILSPVWTRLQLSIRSKKLDILTFESGGHICLSWPDVLTIVKELGSKELQKSLNFRFRPQGHAAEKLKEFVEQLKKMRNQRASLKLSITNDEIIERLNNAGFTKRHLKPFQLRDLSQLITLENGANFSVPGAGKTTVTFALHTLTRKPGQHFIVVAPKAAIQAWLDIVSECMDENSPDNGAEEFVVLDGDERRIRNSLNSGATRFIITYDLIIRQQNVITHHLSTKSSHLVLDESHRMKAGLLSQRGSFLLSISELPIRRDILTGTPMPQGALDIKSQLEFLWPGHGLGLEILYGKPPRDVLSNLYVRTTKKELGLPKVKRHFIDIDMLPGQLALYSIVRNEFLRDFSKKFSSGVAGSQFIKARKSIMRLLQLSVNPVLALNAMVNDDARIDSAIIDQVLEEGNSSKMEAVADHARELAKLGQKSVIWTIFTGTIESLTSSLADINPVFIHGGVSSGSVNDIDTREGRIKKFHEDQNCHVLIANPAAAGEGISLHKVCHNALYVDRSYVSTHYLQSIDRIHRLGLSPDQETNIYIYRTKAPPVVGSVDLSVSRRLTDKIRKMQILLDDPDLHQIAFDEEQADDPIDYDIELQDIIDLISELEGKSEDSFLEGI